MKKYLQEEGHLDERCALRLIELARQIFEREPNILILQRPVTIVADIHGQFHGDYVDRGQIEEILKLVK